MCSVYNLFNSIVNLSKIDEKKLRKEAEMNSKKLRKTTNNIDEFAQKFLHDYPEAQRALDSFGIAYEQYKQYLAAQQKPIFYTASSTSEGVPNGELD